MPTTEVIPFTRVVLDMPSVRLYVRAAVQDGIFYLRAVTDDDGTPYQLVIVDTAPKPDAP